MSKSILKLDPLAGIEIIQIVIEAILQDDYDYAVIAVPKEGELLHCISSIAKDSKINIFRGLANSFEAETEDIPSQKTIVQ